MDYQYFNLFNLTEKLASSISNIISKKEAKDYICKVLSVTVPEHKELVFRSPLTQEQICRPGCSSLSGAQIAAINEKYGRYVEDKVPAKEYTFLVVMDKEGIKKFSEMSFKSIDEIQIALNILSVLNILYDGAFDSRILSQKFPYLEEFFDNLDKWRAETKRVTLDNDVLENSINKTLANSKTNVRKPIQTNN